jgi:hypothetical protein
MWGIPGMLPPATSTCTFPSLSCGIAAAGGREPTSIHTHCLPDGVKRAAHRPRTNRRSAAEARTTFPHGRAVPDCDSPRSAGCCSGTRAAPVRVARADAIHTRADGMTRRCRPERDRICRRTFRSGLVSS